VKDAAELLAAADAVLLDFDGPVTPLMPSPINAHAANGARTALHQHGITPPDDIATTTDHLAVLRWAGEHATSALNDVETACTDAEVTAARTCHPTPGAHKLMAALHRTSTPVVIVSNNAADAIHVYLDRHHLAELVRGVVGRPAGHPDLMKPNTHTVHTALRILDTAPTLAVMIGDSVSDVEVARAAHIRAIGYAKTQRRGDELAAAGTDSITSSMAIRVLPHPQ
jgi:phosphoglycolate phosphatase-like HAD superfamily hydrolase